MKKIYLLLLLVSFYSNANAQQWEWGFANYNAFGGPVVYDSNGKLFLSGVGKINPGSFIEKFNQLGDSIWGIDVDIAYPQTMKLFDDSFFYIGGYGYSSCCQFLAKLDINGNIIWNYTNPYSVTYATVNSISLDSQGNIYAAGVYDSDSVTSLRCQFGPGLGYFVEKLSPIGNCLWSTTLPYDHYKINIVVDHNDDLIISTRDSLIKISNGNVLWTKYLDTAYISDVGVDVNNNIYLAGGASHLVVDSFNYSGQPNKWIVVKISPSGQFVWLNEHAGGGSKMFVGHSIYTIGLYDTTIVKISLNGDSVWSDVFHRPNTYGTYMEYITGTEDGHVAVAGEFLATISFGNFQFQSSSGYTAFIGVLYDNAVTTTDFGVVDNLFSIFPNPTTSTFTFTSPQSTLNSKLKIYNTYGAIIHESTINNQSSTIDLSTQPKGLYFLQVNNTIQKISLIN
jgi:hypothetical protein